MKKFKIVYQTMRKIDRIVIEAENLAEAIGYAYARTAETAKGYGMWKIRDIVEIQEQNDGNR